MAYYNLYAAIMMAHLKMIKDYMRVGDEEVIYVPEANTYHHSNVTLWRYVKNMAAEKYDITLKVYMQLRQHTKMWDIGRLVTVTKGVSVVALHEQILNGQLGRNVVLFSFGTMIRGIFIKQKNLLQYRYKIDLDHRTTAPSVDMDDSTPKSVTELFRLDPAQCVDYIFHVLGGRDCFIHKFNKVIAEDGKLTLEKLMGQMALIQLRKTDRGGLKVTTGGKKSMGFATYSRDDLFSSILLATEVFCPVTSHTWLVTDAPETVRGSTLCPST